MLLLCSVSADCRGISTAGVCHVSAPASQVCSFAIKDGRVFFRNRYIRTEAFLREQAAQKLLYRCLAWRASYGQAQTQAAVDYVPFQKARGF